MRLLNFLLNLLFPPRCAHCKTEGEFLCEECWEKLQKKPISKGFNPQKEVWQHLDGLIYALDYHQNPAVQAMLAQFKYKFNQVMANYLAELMVEKLGELRMVKGRPIILIPIPLHKRRQRERGFNQAEVLSCGIEQKYSSELRVWPALKRVKYTSQQAKLKREERHKNLKEAFAVSSAFDLEELKASVCFLVDDVCTTGSTLENAAGVLKAAGVRRVYGLVAARAFG